MKSESVGWQSMIYKDQASSHNKSRRAKIVELTKNIELEKKKLKKIERDFKKINLIKKECEKRTKEGNLINKSINEMINDIRFLMESHIYVNDNLPIFYEAPIFYDKKFGQCFEQIIENDELYLPFYNKKENTTISGKIMTTVQNDCDILNMDKMKFVVLGVINTTDNVNTTENVNNPPNPPYININELKYNLYKHREDINHGDLNGAYNNVKEKLKKYTFYYDKNNDKYKNIRDIDSNARNHKKNAMEQIDTINKTTLIGTLEYIDKLTHYVFNKMPCLISELKSTPSNPKTIKLLKKFDDEDDLKRTNERIKLESDTYKRERERERYMRQSFNDAYVKAGYEKTRQLMQANRSAQDRIKPMVPAGTTARKGAMGRDDSHNAKSRGRGGSKTKKKLKKTNKKTRNRKKNVKNKSNKEKISKKSLKITKAIKKYL